MFSHRIIDNGAYLTNLTLLIEALTEMDNSVALMLGCGTEDRTDGPVPSIDEFKILVWSYCGEVAIWLWTHFFVAHQS